MKLAVKFTESEQSFHAQFGEMEKSYHASFGNVLVVKRADIPPEYGLVTYHQDRTITVS